MRHWIGSVVLNFFLCTPMVWAHLPFAANDDHHHHEVALAERGPASLQRTHFARQRIKTFRVSGDDHELDRAWRYLEQDLEQPQPAYETLLVAAYVVQAQHRFEAAIRYLERAQASRPLDDEGWLLKASLHLLAGEDGAGLAACRSLSVRNLYARLFCEGRVASLDPRSAQRAYTKLAPLVSSFEAKPEVVAWARSVLGDLAVATGATELAIDHYAASLARSDRSQVRAALVDQLVFAGRWQEAWHFLQTPGQSLALHVRRFIVAAQVGELGAVRREIAQTDRRFRQWMARGDWLHAREMARFYLDVLHQPYLANRLARINYMLQKEPEDRRLIQRAL